MQEPDLRIT